MQTFDYRGRVERSRRRPGRRAPPRRDARRPRRHRGGFGYRIVYVEPARIAAAVRAITGTPGAAAVRARARVRQPDAGAGGHGRLRVPAGAAGARRAGAAPGGRAARGGSGRPRGSPAAPPRRPALARARAFLDSRRAIVRSAELEAVTGLGRYELARQFRAVYGTSPYRYSLMRRLDFARSRLRRRDTAGRAGAAAGFADQAHFTRMSGAWRHARRYARLRAGARLAYAWARFCDRRPLAPRRGVPLRLQCADDRDRRSSPSRPSWAGCGRASGIRRLARGGDGVSWEAVSTAFVRERAGDGARWRHRAAPGRQRAARLGRIDPSSCAPGPRAPHRLGRELMEEALAACDRHLRRWS